MQEHSRTVSATHRQHQQSPSTAAEAAARVRAVSDADSPEAALLAAAESLLAQSRVVRKGGLRAAACEWSPGKRFQALLAHGHADDTAMRSAGSIAAKRAVLLAPAQPAEALHEAEMLERVFQQQLAVRLRHVQRVHSPVKAVPAVPRAAQQAGTAGAPDDPVSAPEQEASHPVQSGGGPQANTIRAPKVKHKRAKSSEA